MRRPTKFSEYEVYDFSKVKAVSILFKGDNGRYWFFIDHTLCEYTDYFEAMAEQVSAAARLTNYMDRKGSK